ncbi:hypothetical protein [Allomesorhizobium camelthorni]|uniref:Uncharacterized protein n=1 Tax=Allomesorhizobium camelthorni TaxID=475069 RepID=A0A6G4WMV0_9HYPH|nr:hypothetical protein [Mesorhizobium camelthorni]NGO55919.1 hypothetical protein [Mesorhizobium camelthorni]
MRRTIQHEGRRFTADFKAKVALEAIRGERTISEPLTKHSFTRTNHPVETAGHRESGQGVRRQYL